jgi:two-component system, OmpR family, response regulator
MSLPKILVIDDDKENLELLSEFLRGRYEVETTSDPQAAIQSAIQSPPALAIIDIDMPIMNGFEVCETLRASGNCAQMAIVFLTSDAQAASMQRALKLGADDYVLKPFRVNDLLTRIEFRLAQAHVEKDHVTRLTPQAFRVLQTLMRNEGRVLGRDQLLELAWQDEDASDRSVDLHVFRLRKLLAGWNYEIGTIYGKGYVIVPKSR